MSKKDGKNQKYKKPKMVKFGDISKITKGDSESGGDHGQFESE